MDTYRECLKVCFCRRQSLLPPSGIWHSSLVAAHERFQLARTLITVILMRHMLISTINEGVWGKTTIYPSSVAHSNGCDRFCIHGLQPYICRPQCKFIRRRTGKSLKRGFLEVKLFKRQRIWGNM